MSAMSDRGVAITGIGVVSPFGPGRERPYRFMRHPNYVGILLEIAGVAVIMAAPVSGIAALIVFGLILRRRVQVEERAMAAVSRQ